MNRIKNYLENSRQGSSTFEYVITLPMTIALVSLLLFLFLLLTAWINFNALAGEVAKDMNFRQTGQSVANAWVKKSGGSASEAVFTANNSFGEQSPVLWSSIRINGQNHGRDKYAQCVGYSMRAHGQSFYMVYADYDNTRGINVNIRTVGDDGNTWTDEPVLSTKGRMSNHIVQVNIAWNFLPVNSFYWHWDGIHCSSTGYSVIT